MSTGEALDGKFKIEEAISKSAQGDVFFGRDLETDQPVTLKILRPSSSADANEILQRSLQEFKVLRRLDHANAVRVIATNLTGDNLFYVAMEYLDGPTLTDLITKHGPLPPALIADYLDQLASVLDAAHQLGIIHRDVKPDNIIIQRDEAGNEIVKLHGFLFAKIQAESQSQQVNVTQAGVAVGTPAYMSPEQAMGKKITKLVDIYSLGITLYTALTGVLPFSGKSDIQTMISHVKSPIPPFAEKNPNVQVPAGVEEAVRKAMAKEITDRFKSATELAQAFRRGLSGAVAMPLPESSEAEESSYPSAISSVVRSSVSFAEPASAPAAAPAESKAPITMIVMTFVGLALIIVVAVALLMR